MIFNKKQLAVFNMINDPFDPSNELSNTSKITMKWKFEMDKELQIEKAIQFLQTKPDVLNGDKINRRLHKMLKKNQ